MTEATRQTNVTPPKTSVRSGSERAARILFWISTYLFLFYVFLKVGEILWVDPEMPVRRMDFLAFWAAAKLALGGEALATFDQWVLLEASLYPGEDGPKNLLWLYPPGYLALIAPLGALPFWAAWCVFILVSAAALALAVRAPAAPLPGGWRLIVASPIMLMGVLEIGQTSALWAAGLVAALWAMRQGRPAVAGLCIGLLTLKPQLGLLIPVALLVECQWRVIGWASLFTVLVAALPTPLFGIEYWPLFVSAVADAASRLDGGTMPVERIVSVYGFLRAVGVPHVSALTLQWSATALLALAVAWSWSRRTVGPDLKAAILCAAIPLATPYAFYYEMTLTLVAGLFLFRDGLGRGPAGKLALVIIWLGPMPGIYLPAIISAAIIGPLVAVLALGIALARAWGRGGVPSPASEAAAATADAPVTRP